MYIKYLAKSQTHRKTPMLTISDWAPLQNTSNENWETGQDRIPTEKGFLSHRENRKSNPD